MLIWLSKSINRPKPKGSNSLLEKKDWLYFGFAMYNSNQLT